jgi:hypothetical protein
MARPGSVNRKTNLRARTAGGLGWGRREKNVSKEYTTIVPENGPRARALREFARNFLRRKLSREMRAPAI